MGPHLFGCLGAAGGGTDDDDLLGLQATNARDGRCRPLGRRVAGRRIRVQPARVRPGRDADLVGDVLRQQTQAVGDAELRFGDEVNRAQFERAQRHVGASLGQRKP